MRYLVSVRDFTKRANRAPEYRLQSRVSTDRLNSQLTCVVPGTRKLFLLNTFIFWGRRFYRTIQYQQQKNSRGFLEVLVRGETQRSQPERPSGWGTPKETLTLLCGRKQHTTCKGVSHQRVFQTISTAVFTSWCNTTAVPSTCSRNLMHTLAKMQETAV